MEIPFPNDVSQDVIFLESSNIVQLVIGNAFRQSEVLLSSQSFLWIPLFKFLFTFNFVTDYLNVITCNEIYVKRARVRRNAYVRLQLFRDVDGFSLEPLPHFKMKTKRGFSSTRNVLMRERMNFFN